MKIRGQKSEAEIREVTDEQMRKEEESVGITGDKDEKDGIQKD